MNKTASFAAASLLVTTLMVVANLSAAEQINTDRISKEADRRVR